MSTTDRIKQDCLDLIEAVGSWSIPTLLSMKRWSEEKARWTGAILRYDEPRGVYVWYEPSNFGTILNDIKSGQGQVVSNVQITQLVDDGWMVDG